ncbi:MAG: DEAD/DEAH box helicase [Bacteroidetes bacterium]|nr:DEAD/DEAH box helicase [Bacteroidota bacterium]
MSLNQSDKNSRPPFKPFPYQATAIENALTTFKSGKSRKQIVVLAIGLGKTPLAAAIAKDFFDQNKKVLFLAHREELLTQAEEEFKWVNPNISVGYEIAERSASLNDQLVLASVQSIGRSGSARILKYPKTHFDAVITDECHHASSSTYMNILDYFVENSSCLSLGITATPNRHDEESLEDIYDHVAFKMDIVDGTRSGEITPIIPHRISSKTDLRSVRTTAGDFNLGDLSKAVNNTERNTLIVETYLKRFRDKKGLIFATDLDHVDRLTNELRSHGVRAHSITGETPKEERRAAVAAFKNKEVDILVNFATLTEGFNAPHCDFMIMARPTQSELLLTQCVGRVTRKYPGKETCHVVEIIDLHSAKTATVSKIFGFKQTFNPEEHSVLECMKLADKLEREKEYFNPWNCDSWSDMILRHERATPQNPRGNELFKPISSGGAPKEKKEDLYSTFIDPEAYYDSRYRYFKTKFGSVKLTQRCMVRKKRYQISAYRNALGGFDAEMKAKHIESAIQDPAELVVKFRGANMPDAIKKMEHYVLENFPDWDVLLNVNSSWRQRAALESCSEKQYQLIKKFKLSPLPQTEISKSAASDLISAYFNRK